MSHALKLGKLCRKQKLRQAGGVEEEFQIYPSNGVEREN